MISTHSSSRQAPVAVSLSYRQASSLPGFRPPVPTRSYSPDQDDVDEVDSNINTMPLTTNRSRTTTPFGSHKSLTESIQSLRSNTQPALSLPVKKRSQEPPPLPAPMVPKRDQRTPSPKSFDSKKTYQHHHYHNPAQLRSQQQKEINNDISSDDEEFQQEQQKLNNVKEDSAVSIFNNYLNIFSHLLFIDRLKLFIACVLYYFHKIFSFQFLPKKFTFRVVSYLYRLLSSVLNNLLFVCLIYHALRFRSYLTKKNNRFYSAYFFAYF